MQNLCGICRDISRAWLAKAQDRNLAISPDPGEGQPMKNHLLIGAERTGGENSLSNQSRAM